MIIFQGNIDGVKTRKDRSVKIELVTALEMTNPEEMAKLFSLSNEAVSIAMKVGHISDEEALNIPEPQKDYREEKSPSQRLKAVWYLLWKQQGEQGDFDTYYKRSMNRVIDQIKEKLT